MFGILSLALEAQNEGKDLHVFSNACAGFVYNLSIVISVFSDEVIKLSYFTQGDLRMTFGSGVKSWTNWQLSRLFNLSHGK